MHSDLYIIVIFLLFNVKKILLLVSNYYFFAVDGIKYAQTAANAIFKSFTVTKGEKDGWRR